MMSERKQKCEPLTYPFNLNLYITYPNQVAHRSVISKCIMERLQLYRILNILELDEYQPYTPEWEECLIDKLKEYKLDNYLMLINSQDNTPKMFEARKADHLSHVFLRAAYSITVDQEWFVNREIQWFIIRFQKMSKKLKFDFLSFNEIVFEKLTDEEGNVLIENGFCDDRSQQFFKCDSRLLPTLVDARTHFIHHGIIYFPVEDLHYFLIDMLKRVLINRFKLEKCKYLSFRNNFVDISTKHFVEIVSDLQGGLIKPLTVMWPLEDCTPITPANLEAFAARHFPPCMRSLHEVFRKNHHLKHFSRVQFGRFLKDIGLSLQDALKVWQDEFLKGMSLDNYIRKRYEYYIKYEYGMVGSRIKRPLLTCQKIRATDVNQNPTHGCTFAKLNKADLRNVLENWDLKGRDIEDIVNVAEKQQYNNACSKCFKACHPQFISDNLNIQSPAHYYLESHQVGELIREAFGDSDNDGGIQDIEDLVQ